jgi:type IV secretory pathway TraG/TraD family ATPase VirD4
LIIAAKPEDRDDVIRVFQRAGRLNDLRIIEPGGPLRCNFLDYRRQLGGDTRAITRTICTIAESLRQGDTKGGEERDYWEQQEERMLFCAVECVKLGTGRVTGPDLQSFIATAATDPGQLQQEAWQAKLHNQVMDKAFLAAKTPVEKHDFDLAMQYWFNEFPNLATRTRSSIQVGVMQTLHVFNSGIVREMVSGETSVSPNHILEGGWVLVNMPPSRYGDSGAFVGAGWKILTQAAVLNRKATPHDPYVVIWCDEAQQVINSQDAHYLAQCRSHLGCEVFLTQSLHSLFAALKGDTGKQQALSVLANFTTKIFHSLGSQQDAEYASGLIGKSLQSFINASMPSEEDWFGALMGTSRYTAGFSEHYENIVQPNVFLHGLRCGGPPDYVVDGIVVKSGERFRDGRNFKMVMFNQRG